MTLVAISATYGAGGSRIAPRVAERLGVPFLDRAIPLAVAERLDVSVGDAEAHDDQMPTSWVERALRGFIGGDTGVPTSIPPDLVTSEDFRRATEEVLLRQAATGQGVILGRGAVAVLRDDRRVLRVRLSGPAKRRVEQAMSFQGLDRATAERAMTHTDRAHVEYLKAFYGLDPDDPGLYHLVIDSTAIPLASTVDLIVGAAESVLGAGSRYA
jgi:cytidylate kinase